MKSFEYFLVGAFAALGALLLEIALDFSFSYFNVLNGELAIIAVFVVIEETAKFIAIRQKINSNDSSVVIIKNCLWIGLGFGLLEMGILLLNEKAAYAGNMSAMLAVLLVHIATTLLTGLTLAKLKINGYAAVLAIVPALILHLAFNYWVLQSLN